MAGFEWVRPDSLEGLCQAIADGDDGTKLISGGVALSILIKQRLFKPVRLVSLKGVPGLNGIQARNGGLAFGPAVLHRDIELSFLVRETCLLLSDTFGDIANVRIRNMGTLGGELAHGDPHSDPPPVLIGLGASILVQSTEGKRTIPAAEFFTGYLETALQPNEVITGVEIPVPPPDVRAAYLKYCPTTSTDWPCLGVAAFVRERDGVCDSVDLIFGSATEVPHRVQGLGDRVAGHTLDDKAIEDIAAHCYDEIQCMSDGRGSAWYKRELVPVFARRALRKALGREHA